MAYLITFTCYGTWLHGDARGSVDRAHNVPGTPVLPPDPVREQVEGERLTQPPYDMDAARRDVVLKAIQEVCRHRRWALLAAHVRSKHVHVVVQAFADGDKVLSDFKAYASRHLNHAGFESRERKRWTRHGSTRTLWTGDDVEAAIHYVVHEQGEAMAVLEDRAASARLEAESE